MPTDRRPDSAATPDRADVRFPSGAELISAWLYRPSGERPGPVPLLVMAHGLGAVRTMGLDAYAQRFAAAGYACLRSEEHTSELQSRGHLVCRLLLEKKNFRGINKEEMYRLASCNKFEKVERSIKEEMQV